MPVLLLLALSLTVGLLVGFVAWRYPRVAKDSPASPAGAARKVGETVGRHAHLRAIRDARLDPATATGLALTLALLVAIGGGVLLGVLAYLVRSNGHLIGIDNGVAKWGNRHASAASTHALNAITQLGGIYMVVGLCIVLAVAETIRERSVWVAPFILAVVGGEEILTTDSSPTGFVPRSTPRRRRSARRSRAAIPRRPPPSMRPPRCSSAAGAGVRLERSLPDWPPGSPSQSRRVECCSTSTGCRT